MAEHKRPGVVTFVGVLLYIKTALAAIVAIGAWVAVGTSEAAAAGLTDSLLQQTAIAEGIAAVLLFAVAYYLMGGGKGARLYVAIVIGIRVVLTFWLMISNPGGGYLFTGLISAGVAIWVLWALYATEKADEYFEAIG